MRPLAALLLLGLATAGCAAVNTAADSVGGMFGGGGPAPGTPGYVRGFLGGVSADDPRAALAAREILSAGGNAADAAVAGALMMAVGLPSRAGLGGGGACLAYDPTKSGVNGGVPEAILFVSPPGGGAGERPASVPMLARGLFALHARYGLRPFETLSIYAEQGARFGIPVSRALAQDLAVVAGPLSGDPLARDVFFQPDGTPLREGMALRQPDLGATLAQLRVSGVGDMYTGAMARKLVDAAGQAGGGLTLAALRGGLPSYVPALVLEAPSHDRVAFLPPPADGGLGAAAGFQALLANPNDPAGAQARGLAVVAAWRAGGGQGDPMSLLSAPLQASALPPLPASAKIVTLDHDGRSVACALTMNNLFGTGRIAPGTGILLGASPSQVAPPLLTAGIVWNPNIGGFKAAVAASGQEGAPFAAAQPLLQVLQARLRSTGFVPPTGANSQPSDAPPLTLTGGITITPPPEPGRTNLIGCAGYLPGAPESCGWYADPRGAGLAIGSN